MSHKMDSYPGGFKNGILIRGMPIQTMHPGKIFWVNNTTVLPDGAIGGSNGNDGTYYRPYATLNYAISRCKANRGDIIMLMPGHAENITGAAGISANVAGIAIVGLGTGTLRPKFSYTNVAATYTVTAANVTHYNIHFQANATNVTTGLNLSAVSGLSFVNCNFTDTSASLNFVNTMFLNSTMDNLSFEGCKWIGRAAANTSFMFGGLVDEFTMKDCYLAANVTQSVVSALVAFTSNATNVLIDNCAFRSNVDNAIWVDFAGAACSGLITNCNVSSLDTAGAQNTLNFTGGHAFNCRFAGEADTWGLEGGGTAVYNNA